MKDKKLLKNNLGDKLLLWAWTLEIIFVFLGLLVALSFAFSAYDGLAQKGYLEIQEWNLVILGSAVWFAIAFTELLKIPVTRGIILTQNFFIKITASLFLIFICFITFESISTGLDRSLTMRENVVNQSRTKIFEINENIALLDQEYLSAEVLNEEKIVQQSQNTVGADLENLDKQIRSIKNIIQDLEIPSEAEKIIFLKQQASFYKEENDRLYRLRDESKINVTVRLNLITDKEINELNRSFIWQRAQIKQDYQTEKKLITKEDMHTQNEIRESITLNKNSLKKINNEIQELSSISPQDQDKIASYKNEIKLLVSKKNLLLEKSNSRLDEKISISNLNRDRRAEIQKEKLALMQAINMHRADINKNGQDFIYSFAKRIYSVDEVADLRSEQINFIALLIIASLAGVVAFSGPLLTLIALSNQIEATKREPELSIFRSIKLLLLVLIKKIRKPNKVIKYIEKEVEVIKEVPVKKIVKEIIEIPKPVEITRYVGIPVPKNIEELPTIEEAINEPKINAQRKIS
tara:strand:+ start:40 stop:1605 length:1566 start_codon:yes stop_codon:yes gene_type:complete